jgi:hypothetical protein
VNHHLEALLEKKAVRRERLGMSYRYFAVAGSVGDNDSPDPSVTPPF